MSWVGEDLDGWDCGQEEGQVALEVEEDGAEGGGFGFRESEAGSRAGFTLLGKGGWGGSYTGAGQG